MCVLGFHSYTCWLTAFEIHHMVLGLDFLIHTMRIIMTICRAITVTRDCVCIGRLLLFPWGNESFHHPHLPGSGAISAGNRSQRSLHHLSLKNAGPCSLLSLTECVPLLSGSEAPTPCEMRLLRMVSSYHCIGDVQS